MKATLKINVVFVLKICCVTITRFPILFTSDATNYLNKILAIKIKFDLSTFFRFEESVVRNLKRYQSGCLPIFPLNQPLEMK